mmetsp:Transcript_58893/g.170343  ORF Transcript_58893/g.170343 Transcript_58893/m.170343 type:complete len:269 (-) Transcript_58893:161-967(-)
MTGGRATTRGRRTMRRLPTRATLRCASPRPPAPSLISTRATGASRNHRGSHSAEAERPPSRTRGRTCASSGPTQRRRSPGAPSSSRPRRSSCSNCSSCWRSPPPQPCSRRCWATPNSAMANVRRSLPAALSSEAHSTHPLRNSGSSCSPALPNRRRRRRRGTRRGPPPAASPGARKPSGQPQATSRPTPTPSPKRALESCSMRRERRQPGLPRRGRLATCHASGTRRRGGRWPRRCAPGRSPQRRTRWPATWGRTSPRRRRWHRPRRS